MPLKALLSTVALLTVSAFIPFLSVIKPLTLLIVTFAFDNPNAVLPLPAFANPTPKPPRNVPNPLRATVIAFPPTLRLFVNFAVA